MEAFMRIIALAALITAGSAAPALAQTSPAVDLRAGWSGFADESIIHHGAAGAALRFPIAGNRVSLGPEIFYMAGPGRDRDLFVTAVLVTNLRGESQVRPVAVMPYVVAAAGFMWHRPEQEWIDEWYRNTTFNGGLGLRGRLSDRLGFTAEARIGSELELRISGGVTYALR
jgi:hypothetical protein